MSDYRVFTRSATNWSEFFSARKMTLSHVGTIEEARWLCEHWNAERTPAQIRRGTKAEFERE